MQTRHRGAQRDGVELANKLIDSGAAAATLEAYAKASNA